MSSYYGDIGNFWIASAIHELTDEVRGSRIEKEEEEFWNEWTKQIIFENGFGWWYKKFWKILKKSHTWRIFFSIWFAVSWFLFCIVFSLIPILWIIVSKETMMKVVFPFVLIIYLIKGLICLAYSNVSGLRRFTQLNSSDLGGRVGLIFKECKSTFEKVLRHLWMRPFPWISTRVIDDEVFEKLQNLVCICCDPNSLEGLPCIKLTRLLNNLKKKKQDLGGRAMMIQDFQKIESPITLWKIKFSKQGRLLYDEQSEFKYSFSAEDIEWMKSELDKLKETKKSKNVF